jgi:uncharacterized protein YkwD
VHHRSARRPLTAPVTGPLSRWGVVFRAVLRVRTGRLVLGALVTAAVTTLVLAVPVVSGQGSGMPSVVFDASATSTTPSAEGTSPVVMGVDGRPLESATYARAAASASTAETAVAAPGPTGSAPRESTSSSAPDGSAPDGSGVAAGGTSASSAPAGTPTGSTGTSSPRSSAPGSPGSGASSHPAPATPEAPSPDHSAPPVSIPPAVPVDIDPEDELVALLDRARAHCDPLTTDDLLTAAAREHSADMRDEGFFGLRDPDGGSPLDRGGRTASIARGGTSAGGVLADWLADPDDHAALLDCGLSSVGIGLADGADGPWWTLLLA